jgi:hypothetical protein
VSSPRVGVAEFEEIFESVKNWNRWGPDDELGTLNYVTLEKVRAAAALVRSGRRAPPGTQSRSSELTESSAAALLD